MRNHNTVFLGIAGLLTLLTPLSSGLKAIPIEEYCVEANSCEDPCIAIESSNDNCQCILTFDDAVTRIFEASPLLRISAAEVDEKKGDVIQAGMYPNPEFEYSVENVLGNRGWKGWRSAESRYAISELIEFGNKRRFRSSTARYQQYAAEWGYQAKQLELLNTLAKAFINVMYSQELLKLAEEHRKIAENVLRVVQDKVDSGKVSLIQKNKAEVEYAEAEVALDRYWVDFDIAKENLSILWGSICPDFTWVDFPFFDAEMPTTFEQCWQDIKSNPELLKAQFEHLSAHQLLKLEKAAAIPDVIVSIGCKTIQNTRERGMLFGASIPLPLFDRNQGNIYKAESEIAKRQDIYRQIELLLQFKLSARHKEFVRAYLEVNRLKNAMLPIATNSFELAEEGYREGKFEYLDMLDSQRTLFEVKEKYIHALLNYHQRRADIEYLNSQVD